MFLTQVKGFKDYVELYVKGDQSQAEDEIPRKIVYEAVNPRWEVAVTASNHGFQQASFVNSIATTKASQCVTCIHMHYNILLTPLSLLFIF